MNNIGTAISWILLISFALAIGFLVHNEPGTHSLWYKLSEIAHQGLDIRLGR